MCRDRSPLCRTMPASQTDRQPLVNCKTAFFITSLVPYLQASLWLTATHFCQPVTWNNKPTPGLAQVCVFFCVWAFAFGLRLLRVLPKSQNPPLSQHPAPSSETSAGRAMFASPSLPQYLTSLHLLRVIWVQKENSQVSRQREWAGPRARAQITTLPATSALGPRREGLDSGTERTSWLGDCSPTDWQESICQPEGPVGFTV